MDILKIANFLTMWTHCLWWHWALLYADIAYGLLPMHCCMAVGTEVVTFVLPVVDGKQENLFVFAPCWYIFLSWAAPFLVEMSTVIDHLAVWWFSSGFLDLITF